MGEKVIRIDRKNLVIKWQESDLSKDPAIRKCKLAKDSDTVYLAKYDNKAKVTTVDKRAPQEYKYLAALCESLYQGEHRQHFKDHGKAACRRERVERYIINIIIPDLFGDDAENTAQAYIEGRIKAYDLMLYCGLGYVHEDAKAELEKSFTFLDDLLKVRKWQYNNRVANARRRSRSHFPHRQNPDRISSRRYS